MLFEYLLKTVRNLTSIENGLIVLHNFILYRFVDTGEFLVQMKTAAKLAPTRPYLCHLSAAARYCAVSLHRPIILSCQPALGSKQVPLPPHLYPMPSLLSPLSHSFPFFSKPFAWMCSDDFMYILFKFPFSCQTYSPCLKYQLSSLNLSFATKRLTSTANSV